MFGLYTVEMLPVLSQDALDWRREMCALSVGSCVEVKQALAACCFYACWQSGEFAYW